MKKASAIGDGGPVREDQTQGEGDLSKELADNGLRGRSEDELHPLLEESGDDAEELRKSAKTMWS